MLHFPPCFGAVFKKSRSKAPALISNELFFVFSGFFLGCQQGTDGQGDALVVSIDIDDLGFDFLAFGENVFGLGDAAISDLGDVDQAVHTGMISAKAPKVISLTTLTEATSPI